MLILVFCYRRAQKSNPTAFEGLDLRSCVVYRVALLCAASAEVGVPRTKARDDSYTRAWADSHVRKADNMRQATLIVVRHTA